MPAGSPSMKQRLSITLAKRLPKLMMVVERAARGVVVAAVVCAYYVT